MGDLLLKEQSPTLRSDVRGQADGVRVKVLLQAKINNNNLLAAVQGLEEAANLLTSAGWEGLFLFLIVLLC